MSEPTNNDADSSSKSSVDKKDDIVYIPPPVVNLKDDVLDAFHAKLRRCEMYTPISFGTRDGQVYVRPTPGAKDLKWVDIKTIRPTMYLFETPVSRFVDYMDVAEPIDLSLADDMDKNFLRGCNGQDGMASTVTPEGFTKVDVYGYHPEQQPFGRFGFSPRLHEVIYLLATTIGPYPAKVKRVYVTTVPHPSSNIEECYDQNLRAHKGKTTFWIVWQQPNDQTVLNDWKDAKNVTLVKDIKCKDGVRIVEIDDKWMLLQPKVGQSVPPVGVDSVLQEPPSQPAKQQQQQLEDADEVVDEYAQLDKLLAEEAELREKLRQVAPDAEKRIGEPKRPIIIPTPLEAKMLTAPGGPLSVGDMTVQQRLYIQAVKGTCARLRRALPKQSSGTMGTCVDDDDDEA